MERMLTIIKGGILDIFPEAENMAFEPETRLGDIPEWDSMNAINLQAFLERKFKITAPIDLLAEDTTLADLIRFIERSVKNQVS